MWRRLTSCHLSIERVRSGSGAGPSRAPLHPVAKSFVAARCCCSCSCCCRQSTLLSVPFLLQTLFHLPLPLLFLLLHLLLLLLLLLFFLFFMLLLLSFLLYYHCCSPFLLLLILLLLSLDPLPASFLSAIRRKVLHRPPPSCTRRPWWPLWSSWAMA